MIIRIGDSALGDYPVRKVLKWFGIVLLAIVLAIGAFLLYAHLHDGPIGIVSGGEFQSGEKTALPGDFSWVRDYPTIEFQTFAPVSSRTVWVATVSGRLFVISGYMNTGYGKIWKQWPHYIAQDDRVVLRIDGKLYAGHLKRIQQGSIVQPVLDEFGRKYGFKASADYIRDGNAWLFEFTP